MNCLKMPHMPTRKKMAQKNNGKALLKKYQKNTPTTISQVNTLNEGCS